MKRRSWLDAFRDFFRERKASTAVTPMVITSVTYDGSTLGVNWQPFSEENLMGYLVTIVDPGEGMDNVQVNNAQAVSAQIGVLLKAGVAYTCFVTPLLMPGYPDTPNQSQSVSIPYP